MVRIFSIVIAVSTALATTPYQRLVEQVNKAYALECRVATNDRQQIRIIAAREGKLRMESADRILVSNGTTVWNYMPARKMVTIARATTTGATFDRIAFELINEYRPIEQNTRRVVLRPIGEPRYGVQQIALEFQQHRLRTITITHVSGTEQWLVQSLRFNPPLQATTFDFTAPVGVEVVDLR